MLWITFGKKGFIVSEIVYQKLYYPKSRKKLLAVLKKSVSPKRYQHLLGVEQAALRLAELNQVDLEKASIAALVHDYAKERSAADFRSVITKSNLDPDLLNWNNVIWHGVVGAQMIKDELGIQDEEILDAVRKHTVGAPQMTLLDKIIYVADFIEEGRVFPDAQLARTIAYADLDSAVAFETKHTLQYLMSANKVIYPAAILTYNKWVVEN
ncbi:bis(5'-nucleosyl)-tetraphosphatase (symmetrical) YqeK [Liquorilactobacillus satsumensis]|nr:bis(5'-nucleosyl)-tetraphosphatase (symmetrical) YqeK [Liquorilactobacillus satsumensis]MCP9328323.1 bis(5'-nucleosyl)-tetraphosphatase (symmetrical) YqeK [Liquorilactobacillus satsumensis]MCP9359010.1 bis(5'-nucleosyl)-tetraphosphatase (symmetrical) YqeK [Liquorilactobacillus satsumensis]